MAKIHTMTIPPAWQRLKRFAFPALIALVAALGTAHILVRTSTYGAMLRSDTFSYLAVAEGLVAGDGLGSLAIFPPLFSMALAFLSLFGIEPMDGGRLLNAAAFGLLILVSGLWLSRRLESPWVALAAAVAVMVGLPLAHSASTLLTEPLFILFTVLALMPLETFLNRGGGKRSLVLAAVFAALAVLTRYMGVALIFSAVVLLLLRRGTPMRERLQDVLAFGAISSLPLAALLARNYLVTGTLTGNRAAALERPLSDSLAQIVAVFQKWADPPSLIPWQLQHWPVLAVGLLLLLAALLVTDHRLRRESAVFWFFALAYLAVIVAVVPFTSWQGIDSRYLVPVYVPLLFVAVFWLDGLLRSRPGARLAVIRWALVALALIGGSLHIAVSAQQNLRLTATALESGYIGKSLNTAHWEDSELVEYLRENPVAGRYYSNHPDVLRWNAGITAMPMTGVPMLHRDERAAFFGGRIAAGDPMTRRDAHDIYDCQDWFERAVLQSQQHSEPEKHFVWVGQGERSQVNCTLLQMESELPLEPLAELSDGAVFRFNPAFDSAGARRSAYAALVSGEPVTRAAFDIYISKNTLLYAKEPCAPADTEGVFFLHLIPNDIAALPNHRQQYGYDNLDFNHGGITVDGRCIIVAPLPEYDIARIRTGQYAPGQGLAWEVEFPFDAPE